MAENPSPDTNEVAGTTPRAGTPGPLAMIQFASWEQFEDFRALLWRKQLADLINPAYIPDVVLAAVAKSGESNKAIKIKELPK